MWRRFSKPASEPSGCRNTSEPSPTRWDGWAKAVAENKLGNLEAGELRGLPVSASPTVTSHEGS